MLCSTTVSKKVKKSQLLQEPSMPAGVVADMLHLLHKILSSYKGRQVEVREDGLSVAKTRLGKEAGLAGTSTWKESCLVLCKHSTASFSSKSNDTQETNPKLAHLRDSSWFQFNDVLVSFDTVTTPNLSKHLFLIHVTINGLWLAAWALLRAFPLWHSS